MTSFVSVYIDSETVATQSENVETTLDQIHDEKWGCKEAGTPTEQIDDTSNVDETDGIKKHGNGECEAWNYICQLLSVSSTAARKACNSAWIRVHTAGSRYRHQKRWNDVSSIPHCTLATKP